MIPDHKGIGLSRRETFDHAVAIVACAGVWILCRIEQQCKKHIHALPIELLCK
jgi:hypothetical protein